ncbi:histidine kinase [Fictibacillus macauensis ZFHKF-1]|uniref:histidine kinase n=1 Tax=Fictibacillus macauensis ZFHKF-1 TaxID=1196324 RepID=I8UBH3_9BACL|nr:ATP-binding protein [Fictibacillus macauensis]EIT84290.1 histidine kinase [Fictibacillus macauensis ZFHKF-1]
MKTQGLQARLTLIFVGVATVILVIAGSIALLEFVYHYTMFQRDVPHFEDVKHLADHFERAVIGSVLWTSLGVFVLVCFVSYFVAKKLSRPLVNMRKVAEKMAQGKWEEKVSPNGHAELNELGQSLNALSSQLQKQEGIRKEMTRNIAHELRTPLATIKSHLEAMEDGIFTPTPERLHSVSEEMDRLIALVQDLEVLSAFEAPTFSLEKHEEDFGAILNQSMTSLREAFYQKKIEIHEQRDRDLHVYVDKNRMIQVLINVLSNALKYTPEGGQVAINVTKEQHMLCVTISDTGIGMTEEDVHRVFDRFYRSEKSRNRSFGGSGIGLTIAKQLVVAHGGTITVQSTLHEGTTVQLSLPLHEKR